MSEETITISKKKYNALVEAYKELSALKVYGVDNWEGYSEVMRSLYGADDETEEEAYNLLNSKQKKKI